MNEILFRMFPFLKKRISSRASNLLSIFGMASLFMLALYLVSLVGFKESSAIFFFLFLASTFMIPVSFIIHWLMELKQKWDMRVVIVVSPNGHSFAQNAINAKKAGLQFRRITAEERHRWTLNNREEFSKVIRRLWSITNEEVEKKRLEARLIDPDLPIKEFMRIRNRQKNQKNP